jgi:hypothetical protein
LVLLAVLGIDLFMEDVRLKREEVRREVPYHGALDRNEKLFRQSLENLNGIVTSHAEPRRTILRHLPL